MSTVVGRYGSPGPHGFAWGASESTGEYLAASAWEADSAPRAQAGNAMRTRQTSKATIKRCELEPITRSRHCGRSFSRAGTRLQGRQSHDRALLHALSCPGGCHRHSGATARPGPRDPAAVGVSPYALSIASMQEFERDPSSRRRLRPAQEAWRGVSLNESPSSRYAASVVTVAPLPTEASAPVAALPSRRTSWGTTARGGLNFCSSRLRNPQLITLLLAQHPTPDVCDPDTAVALKSTGPAATPPDELGN